MSEATPAFEARLSRCATEIRAVLDAMLSEGCLAGEIARPPRLLAAMRHGVLNGGKRIRPFLLIETARLFGAAGPPVLRAGAALECIHCYSLIHDDLPAMDDDDLRRGQPTVHRAFDEATAVLAGDCLQSLAFDVLSDPQTHTDPAIRSELVAMLARASGIGGMAGGQMMDLEGEGTTLSPEEVGRMQSMKTGALFRFACEAGAVMAGASQSDRESLRRFGADIGEAFQLADDMLDITATTADLGKRADKDGARGKATMIAVAGLESARRSSRQLLEKALGELSRFGPDAAILEQAARYILSRRS